MTPPDTRFDPGLQPERTLLAWRRTCLAFVVASAALGHLAARPLGIVAVVLWAIGIVFALAAFWTAETRYHSTHRSLHHSGRTGTDALPLALAAAAALALGVAILAFIGRSVPW